MRVSLRSLYAACATAAVLAVLTSGGVYWSQSRSSQTAGAAGYKTAAEQDPYVRFDMEAYDIIQANYWQKAPDDQLSQFFQLSMSKVSTTTATLATSTRAGVSDMLAQAMASKSDDQKKQIAVQLLQAVLYNLAPVGHGELMTSAVETKLKNDVANVNPTQNLYRTLGLQRGASTQAVDRAYAAESAALAGTTSPEGTTQLAAVVHAHQVLADPINNVIYAQTSAEPTVAHRIIGGHTLYLGISKVAPTTVYEAASFVEAASTTPGLNSLVIDFRGNLGGDLSFTQNFMSLFFGPNQYAYDLFHQGDLTPQRTAQSPALASISRFREIAVLTDGVSQSTAELTASALRHAHLASIVGTKTRGWGSVESTYPLTTVIDPSEQYALLLVSYLTVRDDGQAIEGNGVIPDIDTSTSNWKQQLGNYFYLPDLIAAIKTAVAAPPAEQK